MLRIHISPNTATFHFIIFAIMFVYHKINRNNVFDVA